MKESGVNFLKNSFNKKIWPNDGKTHMRPMRKKRSKIMSLFFDIH